MQNLLYMEWLMKNDTAIRVAQALQVLKLDGQKINENQIYSQRGLYFKV